MLCINRVVGGPPIVGGPRQFAALKQQITGAVIADDEDDVALQVFFLGGQLSQVDAAQPIVGNLEFHGGLPLAFAQVVFTDGRVGLRDAIERIKTFHQPRPVSVVVAGSIDLQLERRLRIRADHDPQLLTSTHTIRGAVAFNRWAASTGQVGCHLLGVGARVGKHPVARAGFRVFTLDQISPRRTGTRSGSRFFRRSIRSNRKAQANCCHAFKCITAIHAKLGFVRFIHAVFSIHSSAPIVCVAFLR